MLKKISVILVLFVIFSSNEIWANTANDGIKIISSDKSKLVLEYSPIIDGEFTQDYNGEQYTLPSISNARFDYSKGEFEYFNSINITVPSETGFKIKNVKVASLKSLGTEFPQLRSVGSPVEISYRGVIADRHIASLQFNPILKSHNKLSILDKIVVEIEFDDSGIEPYKQQDASYFDNISINDNEVKNWRVPKSDDRFKLLSGDNLSSGNWYKIEVPTEGIYRISSSELNSAGANIPQSEISTIKIFSYGGLELDENPENIEQLNLPEQEIIVKTNADGSLNEILFYGASTIGFEKKSNKIQRYRNTYTDNSYYLITWGGRDGKRATPNIVSSDAQYRPSTYIHRILREEELVNPYQYGSGREFLGSSLSGINYVDRLHNLDRSGNVFIRAAVAHNSRSETVPGRVTITNNSNELANFTINRLSSEYDWANRVVREINLPASGIAADNRMNLRFNYSNPGGGGVGYFDYYEIHYPRSFAAIDNEIHFIADNSLIGVNEFSINGFNGSEIIGFDISNRANPKLLSNTSSTGGMYIFKAEINESDLSSYYVSASKKNATLQKIEFSDLRNNPANADVIVVTNSLLLSSANEYKAYREATTDFKVQVVTTQELYNEFGAGSPDIAAIRNYLSWAYRTWDNKPKYVTIWGDGHYDFKGIIIRTPNFVPAYQNELISDRLNETDSYSTEDFYADLVGNDYINDIAIGRIPVNSNEQGIEALNKIKNYESSSDPGLWRTRAVILGDDSYAGNKGADGALHIRQSEELSNEHINDDLLQSKLYLPEFPTVMTQTGPKKPDLNRRIINEVNNDGAVLFNYIGHGNPRVLAHEEVFDRNSSVSQMTNYDKLFFLTAATCDFARFDAGDVNSGAEELVWSNIGGAIAVFSATRVVYSWQNSRLNNLFYSYLLARDPQTGEYPRIGDAVLRTKIELNKENDRKFMLLGDPLLRLNLPENKILFDEINGQALDNLSQPVNLQGLNEVQITGRIVSPVNNEPLDNFNGTITLSVFEGDIHISIYDPLRPDTYRFSKNGGTINKSSYKVENGHFTANFIIPKDISFNEGLGRLLAFSTSDDGRFAKGGFRNFTVFGIDQSAATDNKGPEIELFLDSRNFIEGSIVSNDPVLIVDLFDESGINTTGSGIGHNIEAWINDSPFSINLTPSFRASLEDSRFGTLNHQLFDLPAGEHTIKVRAWDVFNNFSEKTISFRVDNPDSDFRIRDVINYPNPFSSETTIRFKHNASAPYTINAKIYDAMGNEITEIERVSSQQGESELLWNGYDSGGNRIPQGVYLIRITLTGSNGRSGSTGTALGVKVN